MRAEAYASYLQAAVAGYAEDNISSGRWPRDGALQRSLGEFEGLLPQGLETPNQHLFEIRPAEDGPTVGFIWFAVEERHGIRGAYVYDLEVKPDFRRQGHAKRALLALEPIVGALGLPSIGLHVFGNNPGAQALYRQLGYAVTGLNMLKPLGAPCAEGPQSAPEPPTPAFFRALELRRTGALVARDMSVLEELHAPDYELVTPSGRVFDRRRYLDAIAKEPFYAAWEAGPMACRIAADTAALRYQAKLRFPSGKEVLCWHTDLYEQRSGRWQAVWSQATEISGR